MQGLTREELNKKQNESFKKLVLKIRKDIGLSEVDDEETFKVCFLTLPSIIIASDTTNKYRPNILI